MAHLFADQRALFPILQKTAQLSSCSQSAMAQPVAEALGDYTRSWMEKGMDWGGWMAAVNEAKAEFARLINAHARDIAAMSCVSDSTSSIGSAINDATALVSLDEARRCGLRSMSPPDLARKSAITAIHVPNASVMEQKLAQEGFIDSARNDVIRIAPHFYNSEDEVAGAVRALARAQAG